MSDLVAQKPKFRSEIFGKFTLIAPIATGGMGELFLARMSADSGFERLVVIKRILPHLTDKPEFVNMFVDEARVAAQIHHPNVCQILEFGQIEGRYYMALEYLEGISLTQVIVAGREHDKLRTLRFLTAIITQVCEGLHFAHNIRTPTGALAGVVHRDVNPKNIFVTSAGVSKVIDFGIVKALGALNVTRTGSVKGTYSYMSPEQIKATSVDRRSDVFSLGTVTWEAITGVRLFKRENDFHTWRAITEDPIPPPSQFRDDLPKAVDEVLARALDRDRNKRFATARELAIALEEAIESEGGPLTPVAVAARVEKAFEDEIERQRLRTLTRGDDSAPIDPPADWHEGSASTGGATVTPSAHRSQPRESIGGPSAHQLAEQSASGVSRSDSYRSSDPRGPESQSPQPSPAPLRHGGAGGDFNITEQSASAPGMGFRGAQSSSGSRPGGPPVPTTGPPITTGPKAGPLAATLIGLSSNTSQSDLSVQDVRIKRKRPLWVPLLFIAAIFTLAAVVFFTRGGNDDLSRNDESSDSDSNKEDSNKEVETGKDPKKTDVIDSGGSDAGAGDSRLNTGPNGGRTEPVPPDAGSKAQVDPDNKSTDDTGAETKAEKRRREAKEKRDEERAEKKMRDKERREKERKEKEQREKDRKEKDRKEKELNAKAPKGFISVSSNPFATVYIDGSVRGPTTLFRYKLSPGTHNVKVVTADGKQKKRTVKIRSGEHTRVPFRFK